MSRKARRRAAAAALVLLVIGGTLAFGQISGTFAIFQAETENQTGVFQGSWIPAATLTSTALNNVSPYATEHLVWTSGSNTVMPGGGSNPVSGQTIYYADGGVGNGAATCPAAGSGSYTSFTTTTFNAGTADLTGTNLSHWWCWEIVSTSTSATTSGSWTSDLKAFTTAQAREIFVLTAFDQHNVNTANSLRNTDQIILTFNQNRGPIGAGNGTVNVDVCNTGTILISTAAIANCAATPNIGKITGQTVGSNRTCNTSTTAGNGTTALTITLANCTGNAAIGAGTATFTPTGTGIQSSGGTNLCSSTSAPACTATTTNRF